jgi:TATA-binding protein-associated factor
LAVESISKEVTGWDPPIGNSDDMDVDEEDMMTFAGLDLLSVMKNGVKLLGSSGKEFNVDLEGLDPKERVKKQKELLKQRLGLGTMDVDFFGEEDLAVAPVVVETKKEEVVNITGMSSRERNRLKRKAKQAAKGGGRGDKYVLVC